MSKLKFKECENCIDWNGNRGHCADICSKPYDAMDGFNRYMELEEQGMLKRIPVRIGERVYVFSKEWNRVYPITVASIVICKNCLFIRDGLGESFCFGTEVFLTFSEAEASLKETNSNKGE